MLKQISSRKIALGLALTSSLALTSPALADSTNTRHTGNSAPVVSGNITEADVLSAQIAWGNALVKIASDYESGGIAKAKATAGAVIDAAYGYQYGPVLFKPTLTTAPQTFRTTREGALAYFVGDNKRYPQDSGFALKGWRSAEIRNVAIQLHGNTALSMGNVLLTDKTGKVTTVDKTWGYVRDDKGALRIVLHHSSLPVKP
ncbi:phosphoribosyl-AMP cyclohydrolase [Perlucidibaca aquatica]|uniref:phosphoribosyl-AMP cyclohydrolase n=1 Tax=Perlucidibaca aquatica TaxID=1852776 RepID=UPI00083B9744|nr:phosphoribosyl-AMP cyclohydrolase [Perlucidibaca aquatica]